MSIIYGAIKMKDFYDYRQYLKNMIIVEQMFKNQSINLTKQCMQVYYLQKEMYYGYARRQEEG